MDQRATWVREEKFLKEKRSATFRKQGTEITAPTALSSESVL